MFNNFKEKLQERTSREVTTKSIIRGNIIKWSAILIILASITFLTLTYLKSTGFSFGDKWFVK